MLSFRTIVPHTLELLRHLMAESYLQGCRLVGGTALALQYGHRISVDSISLEGGCFFPMAGCYSNKLYYFCSIVADFSENIRS